MAIYQEKDKSKWTKDGRSWYFRCYYTDMYGNRKQKVSKMYLRKKDAEEEERTFLIESERKEQTDKNITFEYVYNEWLEYKKTQVKSSTYYSRKLRANKYILIFFKEYKLYSIKINSINNWKEAILNEPSLLLKNKIIADFKEILKYASENYDFDIKVANKLQKYRIQEVKKDRESTYNFWTYEQFNQFISFVDDKFYYTLFNFLYFTGVRFGEMAALTWHDIDFNKKNIRINKTLNTKIEDKGYIITEPKTQNSNRIIDLDDNLINLLIEHYNNENKIYDFSKDMFIFGNVKYIPTTTFIRKLDFYISKSNVKKITPHGFRHSHVSLLINLGCDSRDVAERIGDTIQVVEKTYYHMFPQKKKKTVEALNRINLKK